MIAVVGDRTGFRGRENGQRRVLVGVGIVTTLAVLGGGIRTAGTSAPERAVAGDWGTLAYVLVLLAPAALALTPRDGAPRRAT